MSLGKILYPLFSPCLTQKDRKTCWHGLKTVDWDVKHQHIQIIWYTLGALAVKAVVRLCRCAEKPGPMLTNVILTLCIRETPK